MTDTDLLLTIRHSASHVLAQAVLALFPSAQLGIGPAIDDGFYYDFDLDRPFTEADLSVIEEKMKTIIAKGAAFERFVLPREQAIKMMQEQGQNYKVALIEDLPAGEEISFYRHDGFVDLCRGPHVANTKDIPVIKLLRVSGAYWRGSEKNKMLQRIYGTAFLNQTDLDAYLHQIEEAKRRDHRILGKQLDLFSITDEVGPGLVLWHPKGACIRELIESFWKAEHRKAGYELMYTPHMGRAQLWETSGHLSFYKENMYAPMQIENQDYIIKPMNCPFHIMYYKSRHHSYRELPVRLAELGTVYRYERSGTLHGLLRVRGFTQDDAHIICTPEQVGDEIFKTVEFSIEMLKRFGFDQFKVYLSTQPKEGCVGDPKDWASAEQALKSALEKMAISYQVDDGGGAFYGPKIDIKINDALGREWQCSTIQFDFNLPQRFDMTYINAQGQKQRPVMIHRALLGALERFFGVLIEHYAGKFPFWLAPVQIKLLTVSDACEDYAKEVQAFFREKSYRVDLDLSSEKIGYKVRQAVLEHVPVMGVIGKKEIESRTVSIRFRDGKDHGAVDWDTMLNTLVTLE